MTMQLLIALATPVALAITLSLPSWCMIIMGILPWAMCDFILRHLAPHLLGKGFMVVSITETALLVMCIIQSKSSWSRANLLHRIATSSWIHAVILPSLLIAITLGIRGISVEFPSDTSVYFHSYFQADQVSCIGQANASFSYQSNCNWYYATQKYLWGVSGELTLQEAGHIAGLNTFLLVAASCNAVWSSTKNKALCWLSALLLLIGFGNQSFHFFHQIGLNGTIPGIALLIASTTPAQTLTSQRACSTYLMIWTSILILVCGYISYLAHGLNAYFTINLLSGAWVAFNSKRELSRTSLVCIVLAASALIFLQRLPWNNEIRSALAYPIGSRFVHFVEIFWGRIYWYWPAMPSASLEVSLVTATLIGLCVLTAYYSSNSSRPASLMYCYLPLIVLAEWILPFSSDLIFKIINPDLSYRVGWTSLTWILIPIGLCDLKSLAERSSIFGKLINASTAILILILSIPISVKGDSNIFHAKTKNLLLSPKEVRQADGTSILAIVPYIEKLCKQYPQLKNGRILSDPYIGFILEKHAHCARPIATRDVASLTLEAAERTQYRGLSQSIASTSSIKQWLLDRDINIIILVRKYPDYTSSTGKDTRHWQSDLISSYRNLALNKLDEGIITYSGFTLARRINNFSIYTSTSLR